MLESCLQLRRAMGNAVEVAATLSTLSVARLQAGDAEAARVGEQEALEIFRGLGDRVGEALGLLHLGQVAHYLGEDAQANGHLRLALELAREIGHREVEGECQLVLGKCAFEARDYGGAAEHFEGSLEVCTQAADKRGQANAQWWLGKVDLELGKLATARRHLGDALGQFRVFEMWDELLGCLEDHAALMHREGAYLPSVQVSAIATKVRQRLQLAHAPRIEQHWQSHLDSLRECLTEETYAAGWSTGWEQREVEDAIRSSLASPIAA